MLRHQTLKRHVYETEHVVWAIKRANLLKIATCRRDEETEKYKKKGEQKSQKCDISPLCGGAPYEPISTKFVVFIGLINVITCAKNGFKTYIGFSRPTGGKACFPIEKPTAYITLPCATALACDSRLQQSTNSKRTGRTQWLTAQAGNMARL